MRLLHAFVLIFCLLLLTSTIQAQPVCGAGASGASYSGQCGGCYYTIWVERGRCSSGSCCLYCTGNPHIEPCHCGGFMHYMIFENRECVCCL